MPVSRSRKAAVGGRLMPRTIATVNWDAQRAGVVGGPVASWVDHTPASEAEGVAEAYVAVAKQSALNIAGAAGIPVYEISGRLADLIGRCRRIVRCEAEISEDGVVSLHTEVIGDVDGEISKDEAVGSGAAFLAWCEANGISWD